MDENIMAMTNDQEYIILNGSLYKRVSDGIAIPKGNSIVAGKYDPKHDGCEGCRYDSLGQSDYPCSECKFNFCDKWENEK